MTRTAFIVAHGQPGAPAGQQRAIEALAAQVQALMGTDWCIGGATLAAADSMIPAAKADVIYPMFMADGWFTQSEMPRRLQAAGGTSAKILRPFGLDPGLVALGLRAASSACDPATTTLLIAAHGSGRSRRPAEVTENYAIQLRATGGFRAVVTGFIEEAPRLIDAARIGGRGICLPFFATTAGHVLDDIPTDLAQAGFDGLILPPLGALPQVPQLIADAIAAAG
ncbi:MAG: cobalamin biosynthesis protein CbiX [Paracoccus denitrificans]|nr:MAG: cobalamin biosynthesis protein CbiX [Paracoccus denitrificans]PZO82961.1 MAG: cobalamin biosynthesis protein CbiX [Paracoccus denitrificans]